MKAVYSLILIVLICVISGNAQSSVNSSKKKFKCGNIIKTFDKSKNETQILLDFLVIAGIFHIDERFTEQGGNTRDDKVILEGRDARSTDDLGVALTAYYKYQGKLATKPETIIIAIEIEGDRKNYEKKINISLNLDDTVLNLGLFDVVNQFTSLGYRRHYISLPVTKEQFTNITNAKKVKLNLGTDNFTLNECHLDSLRKLANFISL